MPRAPTVLVVALWLLAPWTSDRARSEELLTSVVVDGRANCVEVEYRQVARRVHLGPGVYTFTVERGNGIVYGPQRAYRSRRPVNVLLDFDPAKASALAGYDRQQTAAPIAAAGLFWPSGHQQRSSLRVRVKFETDVYAYLIDRRTDGNTGGVMLRVDAGEVRVYPPKGDPVARLWVDARRNCLSVDLRAVAKAIMLEPGHYCVDLGTGALIYGAGAEYRDRPVRNVLLDLDPAKVGVWEPGEGDPPGHYPVGAFGLNRAVSEMNLEVRARTTIYAYVLDYHAAGNGGSIEVRVYRGCRGL